MMKSVGLVALFTTLAAGSAAAQPGYDEPMPPQPQYAQQPYVQPPPAPPAPQTNNWNEVSHINGAVVPVGQRGDYLYKNKTTNIATNPIGWMMGVYGISVSTALGTNIALRGDANIFDLDGNTKGYEVGVSLPIYFRRVYSGPFIEPGLIVRSLGHDDYDDGYGDDYEDRPSAGPSVVFGWHWTFDSGLNVAAAFGMMRNMNGEKMDDYDNGPEIEPSGYFRIGYAM